MRLVQFALKSDSQKKCRAGIRVGDKIIDFQSVDPTLPSTVLEILRQRPNIIKDLDASKFPASDISVNNVELLAPVCGGDKVVCIGMNYKDHCEEQNVPVPEQPIFFSKFSSCIVGPHDDIRYPDTTNELDFEVELAVVIGKKGKNIPIENAYDYVLGYTVAHDVSARDWQLKKNGGQWLIGKTMDDFCPLGPEIVTTAEIKDPHNLPIKCRVNGTTKQDSNTNQIVHKVDYIISMLSTFVTVLPGDVILTGTPPGVGVFAKPPFFLKRGDVVECEIGGIGTIRNKIV